MSLYSWRLSWTHYQYCQRSVTLYSAETSLYRKEAEEKDKKARGTLFPARFLVFDYCYFYWNTELEPLCVEERGSAILLFFSFWVQYYHSTLSKNHARLFLRLTVDFFYRNSCQGIEFFEKNVSQSIYRRKGRHRLTPDSWSPTLHVVLFFCSLLTVIRLLNPF